MLFRKSQDLSVLQCNQCQIEFGMTVLRYNCRKCDQLFCSDCTKNRLLIPKEELLQRPVGIFGSYHHLLSASASGAEENDYRCPQRVCYTCYFTLRDKQDELRQLVSRANQVNSLTTQTTNLPGLNFQLEKEIQKAANMLYMLQSTVGGEVIPKSLLINAKGVVFFTMIKVGFLVTGRYGTGLVIAKLKDGSWSAPSAVQMSGVGWGIQIGAELNNVLLILSTDAAVNTFKSTTQFSLGAELGVSIGPVGRSIEGGGTASNSGTAHAYSYAQSKGLFIGVSVEASGIATRPDVNLEFYGEGVNPQVLLDGDYVKPKSAAILYQALNDIMRIPTIEVINDTAEFEWTKSVDTDTPIDTTNTTSTDTMSSPTSRYDDDTVEL